MEDESLDEDLLALVEEASSSRAINLANTDRAMPMSEPALAPSAAAPVLLPSCLLRPLTGPSLGGKTLAGQRIVPYASAH